ncbi:MAG: glutathione peroxidase [Rhodobacterales bacterium]|nr:glutathione peroxidase [Rhodobacterales bacterium]
MRIRAAVLAAVVALAGPATAASLPPDARFTAIEGGTIDLARHADGPVLVVNTASLCGFARQFDDLQALHEKYADRGLLVLAVPSDDFNQELDDSAEVKEYCAVNFDLTLPMTEITHVRGADAHPFYRWLAQEHGFTPAWNFNKVLLAPGGQVVATWGSLTRPTAGAITRAIESYLK